MSNSTLDAGIPVLTEVIQSSAADAMPQADEHQEAINQTTAGSWPTEDWSRLEHKIGERLLHQAMARLESEIENRVRDALADVLQMAVEPLAADIRQNLQLTLQQIISDTVRKEISGMQTTKK